MTTIGDRIRDWRTARKLTQTALANRTRQGGGRKGKGLSQGNITAYETGRSIPPKRARLLLAAAFGVPLREFEAGVDFRKRSRRSLPLADHPLRIYHAEASTPAAFAVDLGAAREDHARDVDPFSGLGDDAATIALADRLQAHGTELLLLSNALRRRVADGLVTRKARHARSDRVDDVVSDGGRDVGHVARKA